MRFKRCSTPRLVTKCTPYITSKTWFNQRRNSRASRLPKIVFVQKIHQLYAKTQNQKLCILMDFFLSFFNNKNPPPVWIDCHYPAAHAYQTVSSIHTWEIKEEWLAINSKTIGSTFEQNVYILRHKIYVFGSKRFLQCEKNVFKVVQRNTFFPSALYSKYNKNGKTVRSIGDRLCCLISRTVITKTCVTWIGLNFNQEC